MKDKNKIYNSLVINTSIAIFFIILSVVSLYFSHIYNFRMVTGDDYQFHAVRIEGLYEALRSHVYFPRINMTFMHSMGYATSIFYSDVYLYFPAVLRLLGFSLAESYVIFLVFVNFLTFVISYFSMMNIEKKISKSLIFSLLYTLSFYRLFDLTGRAALGETLAMSFLPLAFMGLYHILYKNKNKWYFMTIGISLIIYAHMLSTIMFGLAVFVFLLINIKKLYYDRERLKCFIKSVLVIIPLVAFSLVPILEQMHSQKFVVTILVFHVSKYAKNLGGLVTDSLSNTPLTSNLGVVLLIFLIIYLFSIRKLKNRSTRDIFIVGLIFLLLTTSLFPWKIAERTFLHTIQFPWRFISIVTLCLCWIIAEDSLKLLKSKRITSVLLFLVILLSVSYSINCSERSRKVFKYTQLDHINTDYIGGAEYLPEKAHYTTLKNTKLDLLYNKKDIDIKNYTKNRDTIIFDFKTTNRQSVTLPLIYYKGYVSQLTGRGTVSEPFLNRGQEAGLISVIVKGEGRVKVYYRETVLQAASKYVSLASWIIFLFYLLVIRKKTDSN
ncbi:YfhO family protein [Clostridium tyrobutyricum]|jgi:hypothetical protein|uniref:YfhO family protein n=1 Tax=Clostridium tyrobutyricum TaxID=1519 RepID=UPI001C393D5E|nr:YfhO family protein [Clostridium tyrobutyricum]MBV4416160.1 YfhO family protein [Clostridium tyrobutyricum]MBV4423113.1 YfhO family protein [Clostridium tyrobutyricum]